MENEIDTTTDVTNPESTVGDEVVKDLVGKTVTKTCHLIRNPKIIGKSLDDGDSSVYGIASCEVMDSAGDIVMIDGIDTSSYHNPPDTYMKILANHLKVLPNGESAIIGRVEEFFLTELNGSKALAFRMTWAKDGGGNIKPLAASYKADFDGGYMDSFSVGMLIDSAKPIKDAGYRMTATKLTEISCVTIPANRLATVLRSLDSAVENNALFSEQVKSLEEEVKLSRKDIKEVEASIVSALKSFNERFDFIESTFVATKSEASPVTGSRNGEVSKDSIETLKNAVSKLTKQLNTR